MDLLEVELGSGKNNRTEHVGEEAIEHFEEEIKEGSGMLVTKIDEENEIINSVGFQDEDETTTISVTSSTYTYTSGEYTTDYTSGATTDVGFTTTGMTTTTFTSFESTTDFVINTTTEAMEDIEKSTEESTTGFIIVLNAI